MKLTIRDSDARQLWQLLMGDKARVEDEKLYAMLERVLKELEHRMRTAGEEPGARK